MPAIPACLSACLKSLWLCVLALSLVACGGEDVNGHWMAKHQNERLGDLTLVASHDAGMFTPAELELTACKGGAFYNISITQDLDILAQLKAGARVFDIRPVLINGKLYTAHGTQEKIDAIGLALNAGCHGQAIDDLFAQVKFFLDTHPNEVVLLNVSHIDYMAGMFSASSAQEVADKLKASAESRLGDRLLRPKDLPATLDKSDLWNLKVADFVAQNRRAMVSIDCPYADAARGFLGCDDTSATLGPVIGSWANSPDASAVMTSVEARWSAHLESAATAGFDFSWTATMDNHCVANSISYKLFGKPLSGMPEFIKAPLRNAGIAVEGYGQCRSIRTMSQPLHEQFAAKLAEYRQRGVFCYTRRPRYISMDFVDSVMGSEVVRLNDPATYAGAACPP